MSWFRRSFQKPERNQPVPDEERTVRRVEVFVDALCPCGSQHEHHLALHTTSECARCGRLIAIKAVDYERAPEGGVPEFHVWVGYVQRRETVKRPVAYNGVH